jgi:uncharacterized protein (TIGR03437 family)
VSTPAKPGEIIALYGTGFGTTSPAFTDGAIVSAPLTCVNTPTVTFGGTTAQVAYGGLISAGVYQVNVIVPATATVGDNVVTIGFGTVTSAANAVITVGN